MTKKELVALYAEKLGVTKVEAEKHIETFVSEIIIPALKEGQEVVLPELGKFVVKQTKETSGSINGVAWTKPAGRKVSFKVSSKFEL